MGKWINSIKGYEQIVKDGFRTTNQPNLIKASQCTYEWKAKKDSGNMSWWWKWQGVYQIAELPAQARQAKPVQARRETTHKTTKVGFTYRVVQYLFTNWFVMFESRRFWQTSTFLYAAVKERSVKGQCLSAKWKNSTWCADSHYKTNKSCYNVLTVFQCHLGQHTVEKFVK